MTVLWLSRIVARLSTRKNTLNPRPVPVGFAEDSVVWDRFLKRVNNIAKRLLASSCLSVCMPVWLSGHTEQLGCRWTDFCEMWYLSVFEKYVEKIQVSWKYDKNYVILYEEIYTYLIILRSIIFNMRSVSLAIYRENQNTHFVFSNLFFL